MTEPPEAQVLIVGAGPVGLASAIELGRRGVRCIVVEQGDGVQALPKMNFVNARTMEHCRRWGIATAVRQAGWPDDYPMDVAYITSLRGFELARLPYPSHRDRVPPDYTPEASQRCPQIWFDPILAKTAASLAGVELRYRQRLEAFDDDGDGVRAQVADLETGDRYELTADYLVGADGAGSDVRTALGVESEQTGPAPKQVAIALRTNEFWSSHDKRRAAFYFVLPADGARGVVTPTDGEALWRFNVSLPPGANTDDFDAHRAVREMAGGDFAYELLAVEPWTIRFTLAREFQRGRVLLAGDAARTLSPTGGLGMNTGIGDAVDLGWKLAALLAGWAGPGLLDSYDLERRRVGRRIIDESLRNLVRLASLPPLRDVEATGEPGARARAALGRAIEEGEFRHEFENEGACLGYRYDASPVVVPDGTPPPPYDPNAYTQTSWPGCRAPHAWLADGESTLDLFDTGFRLLRLGSGAPSGEGLVAAARAASVPIAESASADPMVCALYERRLVLVRPDGHVAWRGDAPPADPRALIDRVSGSAAAQAPST